MKKIAIITFCVIISLHIAAQKNIEKHLSYEGRKIISLKLQIADSINVHTWNKDEVFSQASVNINDNRDNEAYLTTFDIKDNAIEINARFRDEYFKDNKDCNIESMIIWTVYIPENSALEVETINGNLTIDGKTSKINAKTISGLIDLEFSPARKADLQLKTITGTFYSDLELTAENKNNDLPKVLTHQFNDGGIPVELETISGNIYLRKGK